MYNLLKSSKTATLTSTVQVLALHIYAPKIYWLVVHHVKHIIKTKPSGIFNPPYIKGEPTTHVRYNLYPIFNPLKQRIKYGLQQVKYGLQMDSI